MADVFVSYARPDRARAAALARLLEGHGWSVWWDRDIIPGQAFDRAIEGELMQAGSVVVLWSDQSVDSEWVRNEAAVAAERDVLVPALIDAVPPPLEFRRRQAAELIDWDGDPAHPGFQALCAGIAATLGGSHPSPTGAGPRPEARRAWLVAAAAVVALLAAGLYAVSPRLGDRLDAPSPASPASKAPAAELADLVSGHYAGHVIADSQGPSRSDITVIVTKLDAWTVRVSSAYPRLPSTDVTLTRSGNSILNADGDTPFIVDLGRHPPTLVFDPHSAIAYRGTRQE